MKIVFSFLFCLLLLSACQNPKPLEKGINQFSDPEMVKIYDFADRQITDSLLPYFPDEKHANRLAAVKVFASLQDTLAIDSLVRTLNDVLVEIRAAAAYGLGQYRSEKLAAVFIEHIKKEPNEEVLQALFEALGKTGTNEALDFLKYANGNNSAVAWGLFRSTAVGKMDLHGIEKAIELLSDDSVNTRLGAAHTLSRSRDFDLTSYQDQLFAIWKKETSTNVLLPLTRAFGKITSSKKSEILAEIFSTKTEPLLLVEALRAANPEDFWQLSSYVIHLLAHENPQVQAQAISYLKEIPVAELPLNDLTAVSEALEEYDPTRIAIWELLAAGEADKSAWAKRIITEYENTEDRYLKISCLQALSKIPDQTNFFQEIIAAEEDVIVSGKAYEVLLATTGEENLQAVIQQGLASKDISMICNAVMRLQQDTILLGDESILAAIENAKSQLDLPEDMEALVELHRALKSAYPDTEFPPKGEWNHPIDWNLLDTIAQNQKVEIITSKGNVIIELKVNEAPGTVASFVELMQQGYYNGKSFHRLVPNFVIQGGCPRGDGWGSLDFSLRSEVPELHYSPGAVGVASAGKDTEGCQFFITHDHVPHLDGRYTIFAYVVEGMDVVNQLSVSDTIEAIILID